MKTKILWIILSVMMIWSCGKKMEKSGEEKSLTLYDKVAEESPAPTDAAKYDSLSQQNKTEGSKTHTTREEIWDSSFIRKNSIRKLIRTAELSFKAGDVEKTTHAIEKVTLSAGGFVLASDIVNSRSVYHENRINRDSVVQIGVCRVENTMTVRVPAIMLDTVLYRISELWIRLDERKITAEDVTISLLANELKAQLYRKTGGKISDAANRSGRVDDVVNAREKEAEYIESTIDKKIENLELQDRIDFSTIRLRFYQDEVLFKSAIASVDSRQYSPSFGNDLAEAFGFGWKILRGFIVFLAGSWSILLIMLLIAGVTWVTIRFFVRKSRQRKSKNNQGQM